ncbi:MAG: hypothetical protein JSW25_08145 [Thermoplasmata archaeon]|nr:MAG: hypothetical protein JSW25_08145 [Thermoplasmata archaeon]
MPDIREQVEDDRGLLKKIQLVIPGFRGYRKREDIRAADSILRLQMADGLVQVREGLEESRRVMTDDYQTKNIERIGSAISKLRTLEGKVRHAEQGYSGFSPAIRIEEGELNRLYEFDASMIDSIQRLNSSQAALLASVQAGDQDDARRRLDDIRDELTGFERTFDDRIPVVAGIYNL